MDGKAFHTHDGLLDRWCPMQELSGGTSTAQVHKGCGADPYAWHLRNSAILPDLSSVFNEMTEDRSHLLGRNLGNDLHEIRTPLHRSRVFTHRRFADNL